MKLRSALLPLVLIFAVCAMVAQAHAQSEVDGPAALITTFHAVTGERANFRLIMRGEGTAQLERWKHAGVFASYQVLFTSYAGDNSPDMFLILRFDHFTDLARWQRIEETFPGGLVPAAQRIAVVESSGTADIVKADSARSSTRESQFFVLEYDVLVDMPKYTSYALGYAIPQFDAWEKAGILSSYASYVNQNPAGAPWGSFIVLEYKDMKSLAAREVVKASARAELATSNPAWKKWSDDKTAVRREKTAIPARLLTQP